MRFPFRLPWHRRVEAEEKRLHETRVRLAHVHRDWDRLADPLARIDEEIRLNDWTQTARRFFAERKPE